MIKFDIISEYALNGSQLQEIKSRYFYSTIGLFIVILLLHHYYSLLLLVTFLNNKYTLTQFLQIILWYNFKKGLPICAFNCGRYCVYRNNVRRLHDFTARVQCIPIVHHSCNCTTTRKKTSNLNVVYDLGYGSVHK